MCTWFEIREICEECEICEICKVCEECEECEICEECECYHCSHSVTVTPPVWEMHSFALEMCTRCASTNVFILIPRIYYTIMFFLCVTVKNIFYLY